MLSQAGLAPPWPARGEVVSEWEKRGRRDLRRPKTSQKRSFKEIWRRQEILIQGCLGEFRSESLSVCFEISIVVKKGQSFSKGGVRESALPSPEPSSLVDTV